MENEQYWKDRAAWNMYHYMDSAEEKAKDIAAVYLKASNWLTLEAEGIFERFQTKHKLSEAEARRLLNTLRDKGSLEELKAALLAGDSGKTRQELVAELEAAAYRYRIERLEQLQTQIDMVMENVYSLEKASSTDFYINLAREAYYRTVYETQKDTGLAFSFAHIDRKQIDRVLAANWSGKHYSRRIWGNTQGLAQTLKEELLVSLLTGRTERETAEIIASRFSAGAMAARRLVRTESCYISGELTAKAYEECGIGHYIYLATLDLRTSKVCRGLDMHRFKVSERQAGKNYPPMHPWCRSTTLSDMTEEELAKLKKRAYNPATGRTELIPGNMTYADWYKKYVEGKPEAQAQEKAIKNAASDRKQYARYREVLGKDAPKTFAEFQKMKYNDTEKWEYTKGLKAYLEKYPTSSKKFYDAGEELKDLGIKKGVLLPAVQKQAFILPEGKHAPYHIMNRMLERGITDDDIRGYMKDATGMFVQWGGKRQYFVGKEGMAVITKSGDDWIFKTAWDKSDYDEDSVEIMEVMAKYGI